MPGDEDGPAIRAPARRIRLRPAQSGLGTGRDPVERHRWRQRITGQHERDSYLEERWRQECEVLFPVGPPIAAVKEHERRRTRSCGGEDIQARVRMVGVAL